MKHFDTSVKNLYFKSFIFPLQQASIHVKHPSNMKNTVNFLKHAFYIKPRIFQNLGRTSIT